MNEASISGDVAVVYVRGREPWGAILKGPRVETLGGRVFLLGTNITREGSWVQGRTTYLAMDHITSIIEFKTEEEYRNRPRTGSRRSVFRRIFGGKR